MTVSRESAPFEGSRVERVGRGKERGERARASERKREWKTDGCALAMRAARYVRDDVEATVSRTRRRALAV